jgi:hypothetical protein
MLLEAKSMPGFTQMSEDFAFLSEISPNLSEDFLILSKHRLEKSKLHF